MRLFISFYNQLVMCAYQDEERRVLIESQKQCDVASVVRVLLFLFDSLRPCVIPLLALRPSVALLRCARKIRARNFWKILMSHARLLSLKNIEKRKSQVGGLELLGVAITKINYYFPVYAIPIPSQSNGKNYSEKPLFSECEIKDKMQIKIKKAGQFEASRKAESRIK
ncbi:unnamed protein product [Rhizophagus irregularis]|nr:unnamed protein product [Rhizophagus irregularis]